MLMHVNRDVMLSHIRRVVKAAPKKAADEALKGVHLEADAQCSMLTMTATNRDIAIRSSMPAAIERAGSVVIDANYLPLILEHLPEEEVDFEMHGSKSISIRSGKTDYDLNVLPGESFPMPELPFPEDTVPVSGLSALSRKTLFVLGDDPKQPLMQCVRLSLGPDGLRASGTNAFCVVEAVGDPDCKGRTNLLLPGRSLRTLAAISRDSDVYEMGLCGKNLVFWDGDLLFSARLMEGSFPDTSGVLDSFKGVYSVNLSVEELAAAIRAAAPVDEHESRIEVAFGEHELQISSKTALGYSAATVKALVLNAPATPFYYDYRRLLAYLALLKDKVTLEFSAQGLLSIRPGDTRYLQSPMRPPKIEAPKKKKAA